MRLRRSPGLRTGVLLMALIAVVVLGLGATIIASRFSDARDAGQSVASTLQPAADASNDLDVAIGEMDRGVRGYVITGRATSLSTYAEGFKRSAADLAELERAAAPVRSNRSMNWPPTWRTRGESGSRSPPGQRSTRFAAAIGRLRWNWWGQPKPNRPSPCCKPNRCSSTTKLMCAGRANSPG